MHALLIAALLLVPAKGGLGEQVDCAELAKEAGKQQAASQPLVNLGGGLLVRLGVDYVACSIEQGTVEELHFTDDGNAVAVFADGTRTEFPAGTQGGWLAGKASAAGVQVTSSDPLTFQDEEETGIAGPTRRWPGFLALTASVLFAVGLIVVRQRRRKALVTVGGGHGRSRGKTSDVPETRFSDVAGCDEAIEDLREIVDLLRQPEKFTTIGARTPKGALLSGPPGTGKTLLARAVAGEAGVPFFSAAGSDFVEMYVGVGAKRVRELFGKARKAGGGIVFIDEIDAVGRKRSEDRVSAGEGETENTLISLLNELDGFTGSNVIVLAATNRPDVLDPALLRPGRLDRRVHVGLPDVVGRQAILSVHTRNKPLGADVDLQAVARRTPGMSGAQLEQMCNEAAMFAARRGNTKIENQDVDQAIAYVTMGRARRSAKVEEQDRRVTAWHEAGHTVCALRYPDADQPVAVSIVPRGAAGGVTWIDGSDVQLITRSQLRARLVVALGGRMAEEILLGGEHTAGAADDLSKATQMAKMMVDRFGMTERGLTVRSGGDDDSSAQAVETLLQTAATQARQLLDDNRALLEAVAEALLEREDLNREAISVLAQAHPSR